MAKDAEPWKTANQHEQKHRFTIAAICFSFVFLAGCASRSTQLRIESPDFLPRTTQHEEIVLSTKGQPGQSFEGHVIIDGTRHEISGTSPATFPLSGSIFVGEIRKLRGEGTLTFSIANEPRTRSVGFGGLKRPGSSCRFGYHDGGVEAHTRP